MKTTIQSIVIFLIIGIFVFRCHKEEENSIFSGKLVSNSACKNGLKKANMTISIPDTLSCIDYSFDDLSNKLVIKHINTGFNCCPDSLFCKISLRNDTISVQEFEAANLCKCNCLYDLDIEIFGVSTKKYQIRFIEPYSVGQERIAFEVDLGKNKNGSYCVTRKHYPWGL